MGAGGSERLLLGWLGVVLASWGSGGAGAQLGRLEKGIQGFGLGLGGPEEGGEG